MMVKCKKDGEQEGEDGVLNKNCCYGDAGVLSGEVAKQQAEDSHHTEWQ